MYSQTVWGLLSCQDLFAKEELTAPYVPTRSVKTGLLSWNFCGVRMDFLATVVFFFFFPSSQPSSFLFCPMQEGLEGTVDYHLQDGATRSEYNYQFVQSTLCSGPFMIKKKRPVLATVTVQHYYFALRFFSPTYQAHNGTSRLTVASKIHQTTTW